MVWCVSGGHGILIETHESPMARISALQQPLVFAAASARFNVARAVARVVTAASPTPTPTGEGAGSGSASAPAFASASASVPAAQDPRVHRDAYAEGPPEPSYRNAEPSFEEIYGVGTAAANASGTRGVTSDGGGQPQPLLPDAFVVAGSSPALNGSSSSSSSSSSTGPGTYKVNARPSALPLFGKTQAEAVEMLKTEVSGGGEAQTQLLHSCHRRSHD